MLTPYLWWARERYGSFMIVFERAQAIVNAEHGGPLFYASIIIFTVPVLLGLALFIWHLISERRRKTVLKTMLFSGIALLWSIAILGYLNTFPNHEYRFALPALVPLLVLAGIGYAALHTTLATRLAKARNKARSAGSSRHAHMRRSTVAAAALLVAVIVGFSISSFSRVAEPPVNRYQQPPVEIALRIHALNDMAKPIYASSDYPIYGYYTQNRVVVVDGPGFLDAYPRNMPRDGYLIVNKGSAREPTISWADQQPRLKRLFENDYAVVYAYDNPYVD